MQRTRHVVTIALVVASVAGAQNAPPADRLQKAAALFARSDWQAAHNEYAAIVKDYPAYAPTRFRLGMILAEEGRADDAIAELLRAAKAGAFVPPSALDTNPHVRSLKSNAKWQSVIDAFDAVVRPCMHNARFREFDFWIGDWDVRPTGQPPAGPPARNTVTLDDNSCVITEHWTAPSGSEGQSFNIFDRSYGVWRQTWVDNVGGQHDYRGSLKDGNMVFVGDTPMPNGQPGRVPTRLTFFHISKDSVRQFSEISPDSGRTWQVSYDLTYVRRK
ncbi:MAG TPA: tetratricopeptide repeat protein [Gemmatimonadaceae bacterium]|nr:tetratricopeptide repeat protein [Gemmatimonadaceae bacterium]